MQSPEILKSDKVRDHIRTWIHSGRLSAGARLPSERSLAQQLGVTHITVRRGLADLVDEGLIVKRPKVGNFVRSASQSTQVAVVLPSHASHCHTSGDSHPYYGKVIEGIHGVLDRNNYVVSSLSYRHGSIWEDVGHILDQRAVRGVFLAGESQITYEDALRLRALDQHIVLIRHCPLLQMQGFPLYELDLTGALFDIICRLADMGHRHIRVVSYQMNTACREWINAIEAACCAKNLGDASSVILNYPNIDDSTDEGERVLDDLLARSPHPTAVVVPDEYIAARILRLCYRLNIRIPDDMSLASAYNSAEYMHSVPITSVYTAELGRQAGMLAAKHMDALIQGKNIESRAVLLQGKVTWTESVASRHSRFTPQAS